MNQFFDFNFSYNDFYKRHKGMLSGKTDDFNKIMADLPIIGKQDIINSSYFPNSDRVVRGKKVKHHTSGSTGEGFQFYTSQSAIQKQWAVWWRYRMWHGIQIDTWCGYFGGRTVVSVRQKKPPFWRINIPGRQILFSGYHMSPENLKYYIQELNKRQLPWIHGYPSLITLLGNYILEMGIRLNYNIRWITTGAENLLSSQINVIQKAFGVIPRQHYGLAEAVANFSECPSGKLHVDEDFAYVEFVPNTNGQGYKVIGTNFTNYFTPMIRYDTGDIVEIDRNGCDCGRPGRIVKSIDGRKEDYVILKDGTRLGRLDHIFKDLNHIREAQIHQKERGTIILRVVPSDSYSSPDEDRLLKEAQYRIGKNADISIEYVDAIERTKSGKLRLVINDLNEGKINCP